MKTIPFNLSCFDYQFLCDKGALTLSGEVLFNLIISISEPRLDYDDSDFLGVILSVTDNTGRIWKAGFDIDSEALMPDNRVERILPESQISAHIKTIFDENRLLKNVECFGDSRLINEYAVYGQVYSICIKHLEARFDLAYEKSNYNELALGNFWVKFNIQSSRMLQSSFDTRDFEPWYYQIRFWKLLQRSFFEKPLVFKKTSSEGIAQSNVVYNP